MEITWLDPVITWWRSSVENQRLTHALMLLGAPGTGKRSAAAWIARQRLGLAAGERPVYPPQIPEHADLRWICPPEDKHAIGIEQIRGLVSDLTLTSYEGGGKVAVIDPANAMTTSAANSLLKTLEEPPGDTLLILVADRLGHLPATIVSRCQLVKVPLPGISESLAWLDRLRPAADWARPLAAAGYAPLAAIPALERIEDTEGMARDFAAVHTGNTTPLEVAARWAKSEPHFVLDWLCRQVQTCIYRTFASAGDGAVIGIPDTVLQRMDRRNLFCYLDTINRLRGQPAGSFNVQLTLESLLIDWASGLENLRDPVGQGVSQLRFAAR